MKTGFSSDFRTAIYADSFSHYSSISGIPPLTLTNSKGLPLKKWSITGNTVQDREPTPEQPIEVKGVGDYDAETGKYKVDVVSRGKNLFDKTKVRSGWYSSSTSQIILSTVDGRFVSVKVKPDTTYTFSKKYFNISSERNTIILTSVYPENTRTDYNRIINRPYAEETWSFTTGSNDNYANIMFARSAADEEIEKIVNTIMLNEGLIHLPYEPYHAEVSSICLSSPLMAYEVLRSNGTVSRADGTTETVSIPQIPTFAGNCIIDVDTQIQPTNMSVTYKSRR